MKKWRSWFGGSDRSERAAGPLEPVDLTAPDVVADPAPLYARLRADAPVARMASGGFVLTRHADITAAFSDPALGNAPSRFSVLTARNRDREVAADLAANIPPFMDRPDHVPARRALSAVFYDLFEAAGAWVPELAAARVAALRGQRAELITDLAGPYAAAAMARFIGLPDEPARIKQATTRFFRLFAPISGRAELAEVNAALTEARDWIDAAAGPGGMVTRLTEAGLSRAAAVDNALLVLADGVENIEAGIATTLHLAHRDGAQIPQGTKADAITAEALRLSTPGQVIPRVARQDCTIGGVQIGAGMPVFLALGSANLDDAVFADPTLFDPARDGSAALTFGRGRHSCIGAPLGRLLIVSMVEALRAAHARPLEDGPLTYVPRFGHRWPARLPVEI